MKEHIPYLKYWISKNTCQCNGSGIGKCIKCDLEDIVEAINLMKQAPATAYKEGSYVVIRRAGVEEARIAEHAINTLGSSSYGQLSRRFKSIGVPKSHQTALKRYMKDSLGMDLTIENKNTL